MPYPHRSTELGTRPATTERRARQERAAASGRKTRVEGLVLLTGIYTAISPWAVHFSGTNPYLTADNLIVGLAVAATGIGMLLTPQRPPRLSWTLAPIGVWLIISPSFVTAAHGVSPGIVWSNSLAGGIACLLGLIAMNTHRQPVP